MYLYRIGGYKFFQFTFHNALFISGGIIGNMSKNVFLVKSQAAAAATSAAQILGLLCEPATA
jgi:hypothetical protein